MKLHRGDIFDQVSIFHENTAPAIIVLFLKHGIAESIFSMDIHQTRLALALSGSEHAG
jgi:hypothetical protein